MGRPGALSAFAVATQSEVIALQAAIDETVVDVPFEG
jgi:hypothetical protein